MHAHILLINADGTGTGRRRRRSFELTGQAERSWISFVGAVSITLAHWGGWTSVGYSDQVTFDGSLYHCGSDGRDVSSVTRPSVVTTEL